MKHPRDSAAECFLPFLIIVGGLTALAALFPLLGCENPVGPVVWFLCECWEGLSPLVLFVAALWGLHLVSYLLVGSFAKDVWGVARSARRLAVSLLSRFGRVWTGSSLPVDLNPLSRWFVLAAGACPRGWPSVGGPGIRCIGNRIHWIPSRGLELASNFLD